jgi:hypothetical protein
MDLDGIQDTYILARMAGAVGVPRALKRVLERRQGAIEMCARTKYAVLHSTYTGREDLI